MIADASAASNVIRGYVTPVMTIMIALASLAVVFFLINGGIHYMSSAGDPEKLDHAKRVIKNALIGLVIVIAAGTLTAILSHAFGGGGAGATEKLPAMTTIQPAQTQNGLTDALINGITGLLKNLIETGAKPFLDALTYFTHSTPLMSDNSGVFNLWLAVVAIADGLFVLVVALLGFHVMSFTSLGLEEVEIKHMLPKLALVFLLVNTSIFVIDAVIGLSNVMISAINAAYPSKSVWDSLNGVVNQQGAFGLVALLLMVAFLIFAVMLMIYYVVRLVTLYIGAVISPLAMLLWLLPGWREFVEIAGKAYLGVIFVLFINVVILELAASIFGGMSAASPDHSLNPLMAMIVGIATLLALLKTQSVLLQLSYASNGARTMTKLGGQLTNVILAGGKRVFSRDSNSDTPGGGGGKSNRSGGTGGTRQAPPSPGPSPDYARPKAEKPRPNSGAEAKTKVAPRVTKEPA
jgi:hypothetical protein